MRYIKNFFFAVTTVVVSSCGNPSSSDSSSGQSAKAVVESKLLKGIQDYTVGIDSLFKGISEERKQNLLSLTHIISESDTANIIFICTHNSRRSHMSQLWAQVAAYYYGVRNVFCYSGGTEATAFNYRTVQALRKAGFEIAQTDTTANPHYKVRFASNTPTIESFSKKYSHKSNPQDNFTAVMTCSHADEACPVVFGASNRVALPFEDPKVADNTPAEAQRYNERCRQIAVEMFFVFSNVKR